jgi:hydrogenase/urease accessory protein HupE
VIRRLILLVMTVAAAMAAAAPATADDFRPAYLQIEQTGTDRYDVLWKVPALDESRLMKVRPQFPPGSAVVSPMRSSFANGAAVQRWQIRVPDGLEGKSIEFPGLAESRIDVLARLTRADGSVQLERIMAIDPQFVVKSTPGPFEVVQTYTMLGIEHILTGFDHLCFVLALVLLVRGYRRLFWTVTAFTLAHSLTLALATLDLVHVPGPPVEATIALSIVFVASEIIQMHRGREGLAARQPWLVAFAFGLLHGLGFAGALAEVGLPQNSIPLALLFFNVGVEIGQLFFIAAVLVLARVMILIAANRIELRPLVPVPAYLIGGIASYWAIERISNFWI